jgi:hypothetical protein
MSDDDKTQRVTLSGGKAVNVTFGRLPARDERTTAASPQPAERRNVGWIADQFRKQEERRCYVCGGRDDGGCHGVNGEMYECPWY